MLEPSQSTRNKGGSSVDEATGLPQSPGTTSPKLQQKWQDLDKLYGRAAQEQALEEAFWRLTTRRKATDDDNKNNAATTTSRPELILVTGSSGTGKTRLVTQTLQAKVEARGGFFLPGKYDLLETPENYAPIIGALEHFIAVVTHKSSPKVQERIRQTLVECCTTEKVLTNLVPSLQNFVGNITLTDGVDTRGPGCQNRIQLAVCRLFQALCKPDMPIVLFLDDLQWAEPASLDLLAALVQDMSIEGLMIVGACRDDEVSFGHHLCVTLRELEANETVTTTIPLGSISVAYIAEMVADLMGHALDEDMDHIARVIERRIGGNVFFLLQFLRVLSEEGLLIKDCVANELDDNINKRFNMENPVALLMQKMHRIPVDTQNVLSTAACFGSEIDIELLRVVLNCNVEESLELARDKGLIYFHSYSGKWRFSHDQIQQSAYQLIPEQDREQVHLDLGSRLWECLDEDVLDLHMPTVVNQLRLGARLIASQDEKDRLAAFLLHAGVKAMSSSSFLTASHHLKLGISLLASRHWRDQYQLSLALFQTAAEVEYCNGDFQRMDELIDQILFHAINLEEKARASTLRVNALGARGEIHKAIDLGVQVLEELGEHFPENPGVLRIIITFRQTHATLRKFSDDDILNLPPMTDPCKLAAMQLMPILFPYALNCRQKLGPLMSMRMVQLTLQDGLSAASSQGFASYAMLLANALGQVDSGLRFGKVSIRIIEKFQAKQWIPRIYSSVCGFVFPFKTMGRDQMKDLLSSYRMGLASGDVEFAIMSACLYAAISAHYSCPVQRTLADSEGFLSIIKTHGQAGMVQFLMPTLYFSARMLSETPPGEPNRVVNEYLSVNEYIRVATEENNSTVSAALLESKLRAHSYMFEYKPAERVAKQILKNEGVNTFPPFSKASLYLHMGLVFAVLSNEWNGRRRRRRLATKSLHALKSLAKHCPESYQNKVSLLEAELFASRRKPAGAFLKYDEAIALASQAQLWNEKGLACERAGVLCACVGKSDDASAYFGMALEAYKTWGATAKVNQLRRLADALKKRPQSESANGATASSQTSGACTEQIQVANQ